MLFDVFAVYITQINKYDIHIFIQSLRDTFFVIFTPGFLFCSSSQSVRLDRKHLFINVFEFLHKCSLKSLSFDWATSTPCPENIYCSCCVNAIYLHYFFFLFIIFLCRIRLLQHIFSQLCNKHSACLEHYS